MKSTTSSTFEADVLKSEKVILLDVWAPWCGPCRGMEPVLESLSREVKDWAEVVKLNASDEMELASRLGVKGIPAYFVYKNGEIVASKVGSSTIGDMLALVQAAR